MTDRLSRNGDPSLLRRNFFPFRHQPPLVAQRIDLFHPSWVQIKPMKGLAPSYFDAIKGALAGTLRRAVR
jgi:hypothetical protein